MPYCSPNGGIRDMSGKTAPTPKETRASRLLIIEHEEWPARALETILTPAGYAVFRARRGVEGLQQAAKLRPDAILVELGLPDLSGLEVCRELRLDSRIGETTPIALITTEAPTRTRRLEALRAGAWDFLPLPPDTGELLAKLSNWIAARRATDRAWDEGLLDPETGLYNAAGLRRRAQELAAEAKRFDRPLACVVFTIDAPAENGARSVGVTRVRDTLRAALRSCDAIGRIGPHQLAVLAPATSRNGAQRLAERALQALSSGPDGALPIDVGAGYFGVDSFRGNGIHPADLLVRAAPATLHLRSPARSGLRTAAG
jgi:PleD family two-component response regulator